MYEDSKIISFITGFGNMIVKASRQSFFCKYVNSLIKNLKTTWRESIIGQIVDSMFNVEAHRNSIAYRAATKSIMASLDFISRTFRLKQGVSESRYFAVINYSRPRVNFAEKEDNIARNMFMDSFFVKCIYEFWKGMD